MLRVVDVTQHYSIKPVLRRVSLEVHPGTRTTIIGPNGMGKTTLLGVMAGVLEPQEGYVEIDGLRRRESIEIELEIRRRCVYLPDRCWLPQSRSGREFLIGVGALYVTETDRVLDHAERLLRLFDIHGIAEAPIRNYSAGQQKKIALCSALITEAPLLLLDEPFSGGLDPAGILALRAVLERLASREGRTIVLTTPVPEIVEEASDRIVVIKRGEVTFDGTLAELKHQAGGEGSMDDVLERVIFPETWESIDQYFAGA